MTTPDSVKRYDINDLTRFVATFVSTDLLTPADPSTVTFYLRGPGLDPASAPTSYVFTGGAGGGSIARLGVGLYAKDLTLPTAGSYLYRWSATGGIQANEEWGALVDRSFVL